MILSVVITTLLHPPSLMENPCLPASLACAHTYSRASQLFAKAEGVEKTPVPDQAAAEGNGRWDTCRRRTHGDSGGRERKKHSSFMSCGSLHKAAMIQLWGPQTCNLKQTNHFPRPHLQTPWIKSHLLSINRRLQITTSTTQTLGEHPNDYANHSNRWQWSFKHTMLSRDLHGSA